MLSIHFISWMNTRPILKQTNLRWQSNGESNVNSIPSSWIKSFALFHPPVNPITFFDSRLLAGTHIRLPSYHSVWGRFTLLVTSRRNGHTYVRSCSNLEKQFRNCGLPVVVPVRTHATTETYETITKRATSAPCGGQLLTRGPKKCRKFARAPALCNDKIVTSFLTFIWLT